MREVVRVCRDRLAGGTNPERFRIGKLPQAAVEPAGQPPRHEPSFTIGTIGTTGSIGTIGSFDDPGERDVAFGHARADLGRGELVLPAGRACGAHGGEGTDETTRIARRADRRAQVHETLVVVARRFLGHGGGGERGEAAAAGWAHRVLERMDPRQDARHVPVDDGEPVAERDRPDGAGGVGPDPGERRDVLGFLGKAPAVVADDGARGGVEGSRPRVVPEPGPVRQNLVERGRRERRRRRESRQPPLPVGQHGLEPRLLRHHLADPDGVGVARPPPGQVARVAAIVGEDQLGETRHAGAA
jgi:hypothetical protein